MAEGVVHLFQVVHIHIEYGYLILGPEQRPFHFHEFTPVVKSGQPVIILLVPKHPGIIAHIPVQFRIITGVRQVMNLFQSLSVCKRRGSHHVCLSVLRAHQIPAFALLSVPRFGAGALPVCFLRPDKRCLLILIEDFPVLTGDQDTADIFLKKAENQLVHFHLCHFPNPLP